MTFSPEQEEEAPFEGGTKIDVTCFSCLEEYNVSADDGLGGTAFPCSNCGADVEVPPHPWPEVETEAESDEASLIEQNECLQAQLQDQKEMQRSTELRLTKTYGEIWKAVVALSPAAAGLAMVWHREQMERQLHEIKEKEHRLKEDMENSDMFKKAVYRRTRELETKTATALEKLRAAMAMQEAQATEAKRRSEVAKDSEKDLEEALEREKRLQERVTYFEDLMQDLQGNLIGKTLVGYILGDLEPTEDGAEK